MKLVLQHEMDDEPSYIVYENNRDAELITVEAGNYALAQQIVKACNAHDDLVSTVEQLMGGLTWEDSESPKALLYDAARALLNKLK